MDGIASERHLPLARPPAALGAGDNLASSLHQVLLHSAFLAHQSVVMVDAQERLSSSDRRDTQRVPPGGSPGYTLYNLHAGFNIDEKSFVFAGVENISDKNYRVHGSGSQEPGINFVAGVDLTF